MPPDTENRPATSERTLGELALRLITAAVLIPFALAVVWLGGWSLALGAAAFALAMAYEWSAMSRLKWRKLAMAWVAIANLAVPWVGLSVGLGVLCTGAIVFAGLAGRDRLMAGFGLLYAGGLPLGLQALRMGEWDGQSAALILMAIVWASDSAAYFAGRGFGGPPLSSDSPNKTWSGALGAVFCCTLCGAIAAGILNGNQVVWLLVGAGISVVAQGGDLLESSIKRHYGVKDASRLVPGHGGVMDRVDGLGAVCVIGGLILTASPGLVAALGLQVAL
ncbi:MAG: phosphatidate cytidylyltransferase [Pseudomonadota bacterium]